MRPCCRGQRFRRQPPLSRWERAGTFRSRSPPAPSPKVDIRADLVRPLLEAATPGAAAADEITVFKNGGGGTSRPDDRGRRLRTEHRRRIGQILERPAAGPSARIRHPQIFRAAMTPPLARFCRPTHLLFSAVHEDAQAGFTGRNGGAIHIHVASYGGYVMRSQPSVSPVPLDRRFRPSVLHARPNAEHRQRADSPPLQHRTDG